MDFGQEDDALTGQIEDRCRQMIPRELKNTVQLFFDDTIFSLPLVRHHYPVRAIVLIISDEVTTNYSPRTISLDSFSPGAANADASEHLLSLPSREEPE